MAQQQALGSTWRSGGSKSGAVDPMGLSGNSDFRGKQQLMHYGGSGKPLLPEIPLIPLSPVQKLRRHRSTPIIHSDVQEPAVDYKTLQEDRIRYPHSFHRYHLIHGLSVIDQERIVQSARDQCYHTNTGKFRNSSGLVTYSHSQKMKVEIDANNLCAILADKPANGACGWRIFDVEHQFRMRQGRNGVWWDYGMALSAFMSLFLRTFELYGTHASPHQSYVRLRHKWAVKVLDHSDTIMVHLARLKDPKLLRYHKAKQLSPITDVVGLNMEEAAAHNFSTGIKLKIHVPEVTLLPEPKN